jgi:hypothetical protein
LLRFEAREESFRRFVSASLRAACGVAEFCYNPERSKQVRDEDA